MARSKKDGRARGGHKLRKWQQMNCRRREQRARALARAVDEFEVEQTELDIELTQELELLEEADWFHEWQDWDEGEGWGDFDAELYDHLGSLNFMFDPFGFHHEEAEPEPAFDVFQAVDRAVRRHGIDEARHRAPLLATVLDVSVWEINRCLKLTRAGYCNEVTVFHNQRR
jgi:hypothetical protein